MSIFVEYNQFMKNIFIILCLTLSLIGCKTAPINQKANKKRVGLWIEEYSIDSTHYISIGKYKNGDPIKKWHYYLNEKVIKREKYKRNICKTTNYYDNGKIQSKGLTKTTTDNIETHWFYDGTWKFYDEKGKLITIRKYNNGELLSEVEFNQK
jgi:antitoxin component YwqK of YwqJK toxin-antitoxin module